MLCSLQAGYCAVYLQQPRAIASNAALILNEGKIAVFAGEPKPTTTDTISLLYTLPGASLAVLIGLVLIRFAENVAVESQQTVINRA